MANNRELSQFGSLVEVSNEATSIKVGLADANVGLGTTNPTERLEVHGNIKVVGGSINVGSAGTFTEQTTFSAGVGIADSIFHIGDTNTQVRFPAEDIVSVETGGSERLRVESGGGIGIGDSIYHLDDTNTQVRFPAADTFTVETAGSERFRVGSNGYVSVGKGAQGDELLHVGSASSLSPAIKVENDQGSLIIGRRQTNRFGIGTEGHVIQSVGDDFAIGTSDGEDFTIGTNNEKRITVKSGGRVGIGTDDPDKLLEVLGKAKVIDLDASNISVSSGVGTFQTLKVTGDLTVEGTTTTLDTNLIGVDRVEVGANSNSIVAVAVTQSGKADILNFFNGAGTEVLGITTDGNITIQNADAGSSAAPELTLLRTSASPANADYLGQIKFVGINSSGAQKNYAKITGKILDTGSSNGTEDGIIEFAHIKAGSQTITGRWRSDSLQLLNGTAFSVAGDITANGNIQGDGSTNISSINDITASGDLTIDGVSDLDELTVTGVSTFSANLDVNASVDVSTDLTVDGITDLDELKVVGVSTLSTLKMSINNAVGITSIVDEDDMASNSATALATQQSIKAYVDSQVTAQDLDVTTDSGTIAIDLDSETLSISGTSNEIETSATGNEVTIGLPNDVTISGELDVTTLDVSGNADIDGLTNLDEVIIAGVSTFSANLDVNASVDVSTDLTVDGITDLDELKVAGVSTLSGGLNVNTVAGATNDSNVAFGARASNGAHVISLTLKPNRLAHFDGGVGIADSIFHIGDDNAQLRFPAADTFTVETAGDERLRVTSGGLVGINTTNPFGQLQVRAGTDANFSFTTGDGESSLELINDAGSANVPVNIRASEYKIKIGGTEKLRITSGGLVGIGITNPEKLFEVSSSSSPTIRINNSDGSITADQTIGAIEFKANDGSNAADQVTGSIESIAQAAFTGQGSPSHLIFKTNGVSGVDALKERLRITHDGNVGIGTDNPGSLLTLNHATNPAIQFKDSNTKVASINAEGTQTNIASFESKDMVFAASTSSAFEERVRITSAGNVGINSNSPTSYGNSQATLVVSDTTNPALCINDGGQSKDWWVIGHSDGLAVKYGDGGGSGSASNVTSAAFFRNNGKTGFGENTPLVTLHVGGTDAIRVPSGTSAQRPTGAVGYIRYNSDIGSYEGHNGSEWAGIGGAAEVETSVSTTTTTTCESFAKASYRSATIVAQITQGSSYQVGNYLLIHDGTTATLVEESAVATGDMLGTFTGAVSGSNVVFQVNMASSAAATVTTKMTKVSIP